MPRHAIRRQIVEVTVPDRATARRVTPLVSAMIQDRVSPVLERVFDAAAGPGETLPRYDKLEFKLVRSYVDGQAVDQIVCEGVVVDPPKRRARH